MHFRLLFVLMILIPCIAAGESKAFYKKEYFKNGKIKSEGWVKDGKKTKFWKFYDPYGVLRSEGHYSEGNKTDYWFYYRADSKKLKEGSFKNGVKELWWSYYNSNGELIEKCQFKNGVKDGFRIVFVNEKPKMVEKFADNVKIEQWTSYTGFIMDNGELLLDE